jgi:hypothetical protein
MREIEAAKSYRADLALALATAQVRLSPGDFQSVSAGLKAEIRRLDSEIESLRIRSLMGCQEVPLFPRIVRFAQTVGATLESYEPDTFAGQSEGAQNVSKITISASGTAVYPPTRLAAFSGQMAVCI